MKKIFYYTLITCCIFVSISCKRNPKENTETFIFNETSITAFAAQIERSVQLAEADFYNNAFDKAYIKRIISEKNSIVYSSLDTDFGKAFFEKNFRYGDQTIGILENGGDFKFVRYYEENGEHHIIFRTYHDFSLRIDDFIVDTVDRQIKIREGFIYHISASLTDNICYNILFDVMQKTNPEGETSVLTEIGQYLNQGKVKDAQILLKNNKELLQQYPAYQYYYMQSIYESEPGNLIAYLDEIDSTGMDHRSVILQKMLFHVHAGNTTESENFINELINYTGDDPIYLFLFGKASYNTGDYEKALYCYENASTSLPLIWDLWYGMLECYSKLDMTQEFQQLLHKATETYGMNEDEINRFLLRNFPEMGK